MPVDLAALGVDVMTLSAHKIGGPKGVGAIILARRTVDIADRLAARRRTGAGLAGGNRERRGDRRLRGRGGSRRTDGGIASGSAGALRDEAEAGLGQIAPDAVVFGGERRRLPNTLAFAVPGLKAETALIAFDLAGIAVSSGSACSSGKVRPSHVLEAMGVEPALADGAIA